MPACGSISPSDGRRRPHVFCLLPACFAGRLLGGTGLWCFPNRGYNIPARKIVFAAGASGGKNRRFRFFSEARAGGLTMVEAMA